MIPIKVCVEGFMSYRDRSEFVFDGAPLWILAGDNGAGKSSVFEAINYVFYGSCRDNKISLEDMINTNSTSMVVEFDFSVDGKIYRVKRTCQRRKNSPSSTFQAWEFIGEYKEENLEIIPGTDKNKGLQEWIIKTIGLDEKTFNSSIYLRQGNADALLKKIPSERHQILEQIVDLSKYKTLEERAKNYHDHYRGKISSCERTYEYHNAELEKLLPVSKLDIQNLTEKDIQTLIDDHIHSLTTEIEIISKKIHLINNTLEEKIELKVYAARWEKLTQDKNIVENNLAQFEQLLGQEDQIKANAKRFEDLKLHLPILDNLLLSRNKIEILNEKLSDCDSLNKQIEDLTASLQKIEVIRNELPHWQRYNEEKINSQQAKVEIADLENQIREITDKISDAETECNDKSTLLAEAEEISSSASTTYQRVEIELKEVLNKKDRFSKLEGKAECDSCGQPLTEKHRISESKKIAEVLVDVEKRNFQAKGEYETSLRTLKLLREETTKSQKLLENLQREKDRILNIFENANKRKFQAEKNAGASLALISVSANRQFKEIENIEFCFGQSFPSGEELNNMQSQCQKYNEQRSELDKLQNTQREMAIYQGQVQQLKPTIESLESGLSENWKKEADSFTEIRLSELQNEKTKLNLASQILTELQEAQNEKNAEVKRLDDIVKELNTINENARRSASIIEEEITDLRLQKTEVEKLKSASESEKSKLENQQKARAELEKEQNEVRHKAALYRELSNQLGREKLQRWLLRGAEETIIYNANVFLERISNRSIELKLKTSSSDEGNLESGAKALDLMANYQIEEGNYVLLPVDSLSGGQRFRVAVSLALGIGQYANTGTRRLESVIIDEGFGSLDAQGRNEMIDEIKSLKDILQRVIIVSHQEEVSNAFTTNKYFIENVNGSSTIKLIDGFESVT